MKKSNPWPRVWDAAVRLLHWSLVASVAAAWITRSRLGPLHENIGYAALAIATARVAWGFTAGGRHARFAQFVRGPAATLAYARAALAGRAPRHLGHNPLGGWMVVALLACIGLLGFTGWLYTTDLFWGYGWLANLHEGLGWTLLGLIALHVGGVLWTSLQHRENLVRAMLTGRKAPPGQGDVD
ncbi:cytochrome b/b6 domain-containing protein [Paracidovorax anthurii]|uniref:Cytochrome b n=1 Tax=Paracidovorax anthurii TaxID=78229 RepID=A0A328Z3K8_9BURK|nr:cytochrome b/b6 domain-containing protein [Paracidovorax anthurii]RAR80648.1 cytochrome b [Paracidovorax anthurii]